MAVACLACEQVVTPSDAETRKCTHCQKSANERKRAQTQVCKRAQESAKERFCVKVANNQVWELSMQMRGGHFALRLGSLVQVSNVRSYIHLVHCIPVIAMAMAILPCNDIKTLSLWNLLLYCTGNQHSMRKNGSKGRKASHDVNNIGCGCRENRGRHHSDDSTK